MIVLRKISKKKCLVAAALTACMVSWPAFAECDDGGSTDTTACAVEAQQLNATLPGYSGTSFLVGSLGGQPTTALLGAGPDPVAPPGNPGTPGGTSCPEFVICAGTGPGDHGYREVEIDSGTYQRTISLLFTIDAQVQHARLQNAGVESIAFLRVLFTDGDLTFYIDPGSNPNAVELRATHLSTLGVPTYFGPIVVQGGPIMQLVMLDQPEELGYLTFTIAGSTLVDSTGPVKWGDLTTIQYGNLGIVSSSYPAAPAVALELDNWNVNIGPLEEFIRGNRVR